MVTWWDVYRPYDVTDILDYREMYNIHFIYTNFTTNTYGSTISVNLYIYIYIYKLIREPIYIYRFDYFREPTYIYIYI